MRSSRIPADQVAQRIDLLVVEAAGRFIEQQDLRIGSERARQFHAFLGSERQAGNRDMGDFFEREIVQDFMDALVERGLAAANPGKSRASR